MPRRIHLAPHLTVDELEPRYRGPQERHERSRFQILWLLAKGRTPTTIAENTGCSHYWIGQVCDATTRKGQRAFGFVHPASGRTFSMSPRRSASRSLRLN
jgi:hypothetical protein